MASERTRRGGGRETALVPAPAYSTGSVSVRYGGTYGGPGGGWFGPNAPMPSQAPPDVAGRLWDYPSGYNLTNRPRAHEVVQFPELRAMADSYDLLRLVIETRKDQMERQAWRIVPRDEKAKLKGDLKTRADNLTAFFLRPDKKNSWRAWLRLILEDLFVLDAPAIYRRRTYGGDLYALQPVDGATINLIIDGMGDTPMAPDPAYQQILHGIPANEYSTDELIYCPRNVRTNKVYGYSPVEQVIMTVNIALRRQLTQLSWFTEGNMPESLIGTPDTWTNAQIKEFQEWFDRKTADLSSRSKALVVPGDVSKGYVALKQNDLFGAAEEWLARVVCFAFSISPQPFLMMMNRATAETAKSAADEDGLESIKGWVKDLIDGVLLSDFKETELEFQWIEKVEIDPVKKAEIRDRDAGSGAITLNESREDMGLEPYPEDEFNRPMLKTASGWVPICLEDQIAATKAKIEAGIAPDPTIMNKPGEPGGPDDDGKGGPPGGGGKPKPKPGDKGDTKPPERAAQAPAGGGPAGGAGGGDGSRASAAADPSPNLAHKSAGVGFDRPLTTRAVTAIKSAAADVLTLTGQSVAAQVATALRAREAGKASKADEPTSTTNDGAITPIADWNDADLDELIRSLSLTDLDVLADAILTDLIDVTSDSARKALAGMGVDPEAAYELVNQVDERAVAWARERAAELVGKRWVDGVLIDNPNPLYAIDGTTRNMLRETIAGGLEDNIGIPAIADKVKASFAFSEERAGLIANTEVRRANSFGALKGYEGAREAGVDVRKSWATAEDDCVDETICQPNADAGAIGLDEPFPSGDEAPPGHPNCRCALVPVVGSE